MPWWIGALGSYRPAVGHGVADLQGQSLGELRVGLVRVEPGSEELLLGKAFFVVAGTTLAHSYFLIERYRPLADAAALANR
jgi:hypothetical protein